jgi:hypothetical protein
MNTAVAIIIFNRPDLTLQLLDALAQVKPTRIYIISDGPRANKANEFLLVQEARNLVDRRIDWPCVIKKNYSNENLGCGRRVSSGINWVFENEEEAIILEDDCIPVISFFEFCEEMLERYRYNMRVMHIGGANLGAKPRMKNDSYFFSKYPLIWGWATWRRAWAKYDFSASAWSNSATKNFIRDWAFDEKEAIFWAKALDSVYCKKIDTWDYQWALACWINEGLSVTPKKNLIVNHGFRGDATHTKGALRGHKNIGEPMSLPYQHPVAVDPDFAADTMHLKKYVVPSFRNRVFNKLGLLFE